MKIMAVAVVAILLVGTAGAFLLLTNTSGKENALQTVWLDQSDADGYDQVTQLAGGSGLIAASAQGIGQGGEELFTVRAYDSSGNDKWISHIDLGAGENRASAVSSSGTGVAAVGTGTTVEGREVLIVALFNAQDGSQLWNATFDNGGGYNIASDVECYGGALFVAGSGRSADGVDEFLVQAYDISDGSLMWSARIGNGGGENAALALAVDQNGVFATGYVESETGTKSLFTVGLNAMTGIERWRNIYDAGQGDNKGSCIQVSNNLVIVAGVGMVSNAYVSVIRAYHSVNGSTAWTLQENIISAPNDMAVSSGKLLVTGVSGDHFFVKCLDVRTGGQHWQSLVLNMGMFNFRAAVDVKGDVVSAAFFAQNITDDADYTWEINVGQYELGSGDKMGGNITTGTGRTTMNVDVLIQGDKVYFTTGIESTVSAPVLSLLAGPSGTNVAVDGRNIMVNGENFTFKGVNYSPAPIGSNNGWCPWGDWFQSYWKSIYQRDIPAMAAMGVNVVKVYSMTGFPWDGDPNKNMIDHTDFYDALHRAGIYVIPSVYTTSVNIISYDPQSWDAQKFMMQWKAIVAEGKNHPAVLGWSFGNEVNTDLNLNNATYWGKINDMLGHIKQMSPAKITLIPLQDQSESGGGVAPIRVHDQAMTHLDVWGVNSYRGLVNSGFDTLFSTHEANSVKPLLITEFGPPGTTRDANGNIVVMANNAAAAATYIKGHWTGHSDSIMSNTGVCSGGFIFEWTDEWYKKDGAPVTQQDPSVANNGAFPGGWWDEEGFGINGIALNGRAANSPDPGKPDLLQPRAVVAVMTEVWNA